MINYKILKIELLGIIGNISKYTSDPNISIPNKTLKEGLDQDNLTFEVLEFCCIKISDWYSKNMSDIQTNGYVFNKEVHKENKIKIDQIIKNISDNKEEYEKFFSSPVIEQENPSISGKKIFIVHGHDDGIKNEVARFLENLGLEPIILHEQSSSGDTIIEKIERYSNVGFGIVLYTPCDKGGVVKEPIDLNFRARQNVVFEHGYLIGKIGRNNVVALVKETVEKPNDISGVVYVSYDSNGAWKTEIAKELNASGYSIDFNKLFK
ncbi:MAG: nucleotide-binding protein [Candidatus Pacebacteria bacterium]|nr:nucleotide-binding protein [Candidatus Paceibacterota bacterium]